MYPTFIVGKTLQAFQKTYQAKLVSLLCPEQYKKHDSMEMYGETRAIIQVHLCFVLFFSFLFWTYFERR